MGVLQCECYTVSCYFLLIVQLDIWAGSDQSLIIIYYMIILRPKIENSNFERFQIRLLLFRFHRYNDMLYMSKGSV